MKAVVFDMDGTIVDSELVHQKSEREILRRIGYNFDPAEHTKLTGMMCRDVFAFYIQRYGITEYTAVELEAQKSAFFYKLANRSTTPLYEGTLFLLRHLKKNGYRIALTTSSPRKMQRFFFEMYQLDKFFDVIVTQEDVQKGKPAPDPYIITANRLELDPGLCMVIEDAAKGIASANAAGTTSVGITHTVGPELLKDADFIIDRFEQVPIVLSKLK